MKISVNGIYGSAGDKGGFRCLHERQESSGGGGNSPRTPSRSLARVRDRIHRENIRIRNWLYIIETSPRAPLRLLARPVTHADKKGELYRRNPS